MKYNIKLALLLLIVMFNIGEAFAQLSFIESHKSITKINDVFRRREDTLKSQFAAKGIEWPAKNIYIRSFKYDGVMEVWVRNDFKSAFKLLKQYKICAMAGTLGPKRMEGDFQVPEGFYTINEFNPFSAYHLSLGLNYPNASDRVLSDSIHPGSAIYIHGDCVTIGCIPLTNSQVEELYVLSAYARNGGQDYIPVHIYPVKYNVLNSYRYLSFNTRKNQAVQKFSIKLKEAFDYFEKTKLLPLIAVTKAGEYVIN